MDRELVVPGRRTDLGHLARDVEPLRREARRVDRHEGDVRLEHLPGPERGLLADRRAGQGQVEGARAHRHLAIGGVVPAVARHRVVGSDVLAFDEEPRPRVERRVDLRLLHHHELVVDRRGASHRVGVREVPGCRVDLGPLAERARAVERRAVGVDEPDAELITAVRRALPHAAARVGRVGRQEAVLEPALPELDEAAILQPVHVLRDDRMLGVVEYAVVELHHQTG